MLTDGAAIMGQQIVITSAMITAFLIFFLAYPWWMARRGALR